MTSLLKAPTLTTSSSQPPQQQQQPTSDATEQSRIRLLLSLSLLSCRVKTSTMASRTLPRLRQVVLNDVFTQAFEQARQKPVQLTHNQQVRTR